MSIYAWKLVREHVEEWSLEEECRFARVFGPVENHCWIQIQISIFGQVLFDKAVDVTNLKLSRSLLCPATKIELISIKVHLLRDQPLLIVIFAVFNNEIGR